MRVCRVQRAQRRRRLSPGGTKSRPGLESGPARIGPAHGTTQDPSGSGIKKATVKAIKFESPLGPRTPFNGHNLKCNEKHIFKVYKWKRGE